MTSIITQGNPIRPVFRSALILSLSLFVCAGCSQHYCPTYASTSYNKSFNYKPEKFLSYKPVKTHEFKTVKVNKSDKKEKTTRVR